MRRYKGNMLLIELVITLLFFSLSMVVIMQVFTTAQLKTRESGTLSVALAKAEDVAEQLSRETNPDALLMRIGFMGNNGSYVYSDPSGYDLYVTLGVSDQEAGRLYTARLTASDDGTELFTLPVAYYDAKEASAT